VVDKLKYIWLDGKLVDWDAAQVHVLTHGLHYGSGAFEGIRAYELSDGRSAVFRLKEHMRRLADSCMGLAFFVVALSLFPFGVGASPDILARIGAGVVWAEAKAAAPSRRAVAVA